MSIAEKCMKNVKSQFYNQQWNDEGRYQQWQQQQN